ncbi:hypothetical protein M0Q28_04320 [Patescibacteria group bacterium]|jgi:hypothetical protein|nr:hypothetical protein [Patescibacteria group bacterium]
MTNIVPRSLWLAPLAALALFGAGCFQPEPAPVTPPANVPASPTVPTTPTTPTTPTPSETPTETPTVPNVVPATPSGFTLPEIDSSWRTYTNRAETYSFMYPTKGKYAPTWSAKIVGSADISYKDGCYYYNQEPNPGRLGTGPRKVTLGGVEFCHVALGDAYTGHLGLIDTYTTMVDGQIISLVFEKVTTNPGMCPDDKVCAQALKEETYVLTYGQDYYVMFYGSEYASHLDQIMGTFKKLK